MNTIETEKEEKQDYVIDVVKDRTYQNQDSKYYKSFSNWRSDKKNPFVYQYMRDKREHTYVAGEGFSLTAPADAEHSSMYKCLTLLGIVLFVMLFIDVVQFFVMKYLLPLSTSGVVYYSQVSNVPQSDDTIKLLVFGLFDMAKYIVPAIIFKIATKIPTNVVFPSSSHRRRVSMLSVVAMLNIMVIGRILNFIFSKMLEIIHLDSVYTYMFFSKKPDALIAAAIINGILVPICFELLFHGVLLQTFRQFGDVFAIFLTSLAAGICCYDISYFCYAFISSAVIGLFTIRTGSIKTAIFMTVPAHLVNYGLSWIKLSELPYTQLAESLVCVAIIGVSVIVFSISLRHNTTSLNIHEDDTPMNTKEKMTTLFTNSSMVIWFVAAVVMAVVCVRTL